MISIFNGVSLNTNDAEEKPADAVVYSVTMLLWAVTEHTRTTGGWRHLYMGRTGLVVIAGAESVEWYQTHETHDAMKERWRRRGWLLSYRLLNNCANFACFSRIVCLINFVRNVAAIVSYARTELLDIRTAITHFKLDK